MQKNPTVEKVVRVGIKKEYGYLYFIDKEGDVSRCRQQRYTRVL